MTGLLGRFTALTRRMLTPPSQPDLIHGEFDSFGRWESRRQRYDLFWAFYSNSAYSDANLWSNQFKSMFALYRYTRGTYNPLYRLGEFWSTAVWGGNLRAEKQGGRVLPSAIPIVTDDDSIRDAIGDRLWPDSHWQINKDVMCRVGAVMGDVGVKAYYDARAGKIRMTPVHPGTIAWIDMDADRVVHGYEIREYRYDPTNKPNTMDPKSPVAGQGAVLYSEKVTLEGDRIRCQTFKEYKPFAWNGAESDWYEDIPFIPLVLHAHTQVLPNYYWGWSEYQAALTKAAESDDLGSMHHDHIRKASNPKWFLAGVMKPGATVEAEANRTEIPFLYASMGASATPMVFTLDNQFTSVETQNQLVSLEKDYPELRFDSARASGDASAKALREVRKSAEMKVHTRRSGYDADLARIQAMALALGGFYGCPGYESFSLEKYLDGRLNHVIGDRSVFLLDPLDRIEEEMAMYTAWQMAKTAQIPDEVVMQRLDWSPEEIKFFKKAKADELAQAVSHAENLASAIPTPAGVKPPGKSPQPDATD